MDPRPLDRTEFNRNRRTQVKAATGLLENFFTWNGHTQKEQALYEQLLIELEHLDHALRASDTTALRDVAPVRTVYRGFTLTAIGKARAATLT